ncbi:MAG: energy-coupling factor ABC transporter ATP-binding protein [Thermoleophilia bacterium]
MIRVDDLHFTYPGGARALDGVSLQVREGSFLAVMGANGSGKSSLLKHLNGLLTARSGSVTVAGLAVEGKNFDAVNRTVGFVFQDPNDQIFAPTVRDDIGYGPRNMGLTDDEVAGRVATAAAQVGIDDLLERPIHHLSYGQKKRLSIAGVLAMEPRVLILDEPTASLDPMGETRIMRLLLKLNRAGMTIVMATHDVDLVPLYAEQVCLLRAGRVAVQGGLKEVFGDQELIERCHLRLPRISRLFDMFPDFDQMPLTVGMARKELERVLLERSGATGSRLVPAELGEDVV